MERSAISRRRNILLWSLGVAIGVALILSPFASSLPDGLEWAAQELGFKAKGETPVMGAPASEYTLPGISHPTISTSLAGALGVLIVFALGWGTERIVRRRRQRARDHLPKV